MRRIRVLGVEDESFRGRLERLFSRLYHRARMEVQCQAALLDRYAVRIPRHIAYSYLRRPNPDIMEVKMPGNVMARSGAKKCRFNLPLLYESSISIIPEGVTKLEDAVAHIVALRNKRATPFETLIIAGHGAEGLMSTTLGVEEAFTVKELLDQLFANGNKPAEHIVLAACDVFFNIHRMGSRFGETGDLCDIVRNTAKRYNIKISGATTLIFHGKAYFITFNPDGRVTRSPFSDKRRWRNRDVVIESEDLSAMLRVEEPPKCARRWFAPWRKNGSLPSQCC